jgi:hypothetical protein
MRGADIQQDTLFSTVIPEERVPADHPLRPIREMANTALKELAPYSVNCIRSWAGIRFLRKSCSVPSR